MDAERMELYRKIKPLVTWPFSSGDKVYNVKRHTIEWITTVYASMDPFDTNLRGRCNPIEYIRIPPVYDPEHPERSLWGMVDWEDWCLIAKEDGTVDIHNNQDIYTGKLDIALLKAIVWKMEEEDG